MRPDSTTQLSSSRLWTCSGGASDRCMVSRATLTTPSVSVCDTTCSWTLS
ncbi:hypothetical protein ACFYVV_05100 [Streptomyces tendae]